MWVADEFIEFFEDETAVFEGELEIGEHLDDYSEDLLALSEYFWGAFVFLADLLAALIIL